MQLSNHWNFDPKKLIGPDGPALGPQERPENEKSQQLEVEGSELKKFKSDFNPEKFHKS